MKTLGMFLGSMIVAAILAVGAAVIVVGLTCDVAHAQEEAVIPTASQLIVNHNVVAGIDGEDDDLYAVLRGTSDSLLAEKPLLDSIQGPRKVQASSIIVTQETAPVNQPLGSDLYGAAADYLTSIINPDSYRLEYVTFIGPNTLAFGFGIQSGSVEVCVNIFTAEASMDECLRASVLAAREEAARSMGADIGQVHINKVSWYAPLSDPSNRSYMLTARVDGYDGLEIVMACYMTNAGEVHTELMGIINTGSNQNLLRNAVDSLRATVNPDTFTLASWRMNEDGTIGFNFKLQDNSFIGITVDPVSGGAWMNDSYLHDAILDSRYDISSRMGISDIGEVYIYSARVAYIDYGWCMYEWGYQRPSSITTIGARVGNYAIALSSTEYSWYWDFDPILYDKIYTPIDEKIINSPLITYEVDVIKRRISRFTLTSFVDIRTGVDYVVQANVGIFDLFNPEENNTGVADWRMENGVLKLQMSLHVSEYPWYAYLGSPISVDVDLAAGTIAIDPQIVSLVTSVRNETAQKLGLQYSDTHVNGLVAAYDFIERGDFLEAVFKGYDISVSAGGFSLSYRYDAATGAIALTSLCYRATGVNLYQNAINKLMKIVNPDSYTLASWNIDENGNLVFNFALQDGSIIGIGVEPKTGEAFMRDPELENRILNARWDIASRMGPGDGDLIDVNEVHINGISTMYIDYRWDYLWYTTIGIRYPRQMSVTTINARVGDYLISTSQTDYKRIWGWEPIYYKVGPYYNNEKPIYDGPILIDPFVPYLKSPRGYTLNSFIDMRTGVDYVARSNAGVFDLMNPLDGEMAVGNWQIKDGKLLLYVNRDGNGRISPFVKYLGYPIPVTVDLNTGTITIDPVIEEAVKNARNEAALKLGLPYADTHVNCITGMYDYREYADENGNRYLEFVFKGYSVSMTCGDFDITLNYDVNTKALTLAGLYNRATGVDLYGTAINKLMSVINPETFTVIKWRVFADGSLTISFVLDGGEDLTSLILVSMHVDPTGAVTMKPYADMFIKVREEIAVSLGLPIEEVRIKGYEYVCDTVGDDRIDNMRYRITASAGGLTVVMDCELLLSIPEGPEFNITLVSVKNAESVDLYANAVNLLTQNGQEGFTLTSWGTGDDVINFAFTLQDGSIVKVEVNISTGEPRFPQTDIYGAAKELLIAVANPDDYKLQYVIFMGPNTLIFGFNIGEGTIEVYANTVMGSVSMDPGLKSALLAARNEVSTNLGCGIADVKINGVEALLHIPEEPQSYQITANFGELAIKMIVKADSSANTPVITLVSIVNAAGVDLYRSAVDYLNGTFNPGAAVSLNSWRRMNNGEFTFVLTLPDGSVTAVIVNIATGEAYFHPKSGGVKEAALAVRGDIASSMGVDIGEVRIIGFGFYFGDYRMEDRIINETYDSIKKTYNNNMSYILTAAVGNYTIKMSCAVEGVRRDFPPYGYDYSVRLIVLTSLVNNDNGIDLYASAVDFLTQSGQSGFALSYWGDGDGVIGFGFTLQDGTTVKVNVNIETGEPVFAEPRELTERIDNIPAELVVVTETGPYSDTGQKVNEDGDAQNPPPTVSNPPAASNPPQADPQPPAAQDPSTDASNPPADEPMPEWMQALLDEILGKNAATAKGGGSKNIHTYDQMAGANNSDGLSLRWKR